MPDQQEYDPDAPEERERAQQINKTKLSQMSGHVRITDDQIERVERQAKDATGEEILEAARREASNRLPYGSPGTTDEDLTSVLLS